MFSFSLKIIEIESNNFIWPRIIILIRQHWWISSRVNWFEFESFWNPKQEEMDIFISQLELDP